MRPSSIRSWPARALVWLALGVAVFFAWRSVGSIMRESDQVSILYGAVRMADGHDSFWANDHYNFDKQFVAYGLLVLARQLLPAADIVTVGNALSCGLFWAGLLALVAPRAGRGWGPSVAIVAVVLSPTLLVGSPFFATAFVSGGFICLAWIAWLGAGRGRARAWLAGALTFCAVGARGDAALILPWLVWCLLPARSLVACARHPRTVAIALAGGAALLVGRALYRGDSITFHPPFFIPKLYLGYLVFGCGAAAFVLAWFVLRLVAIARTRAAKRRATALFYGGGAVALCLPALYYAGQMFSPRYWTVTLCALLCGLVTRRGAFLFRGGLSPRIAPLAAGGLVAAAVLPLLVGLNLPELHRPRLTLTSPTLFPTADGLHPMGGVVPFLDRIRTAPGHAIDHNQATWLAARSTVYTPDGTGAVPVLEFSLRSYVQLACALQGLTPRITGREATFFYSDARDLLRTYAMPDRLQPTSNLGLAVQRDVRSAGPSVNGCRIVTARPGPASDPDWPRQIALARACGGNEFTRRGPLSAGADVPLESTDDGKTVVLIGAAPFTVSASHAPARRWAAEPRDGFFVLRLTAADRGRAGLRLVAGDAHFAVTVHPDYMAIGRLR